jgi:heme-binding protein
MLGGGFLRAAEISPAMDGGRKKGKADLPDLGQARDQAATAVDEIPRSGWFDMLRKRSGTTTPKEKPMIFRTLLAAILIAAPALAMPTAQAQPGCTASGLTSALATVASGTSGFLADHPEAEAAVNTADENQIRTYFATHQDEWRALQGIAAPLRNLRSSCPQQVNSGDVARLFDAMAS